MIGAGGLIVIIIGLLLTVFWIVEFIDLMRYEDTDFPGKYDKVFWFIILLLFNIIGAFMFSIYKRRIR
jgi:hypothetical protein